ncbi:MAG: CocE/NonD family hydrolase C-terminal non-catalytic domain-containing protein, partial [Anaerolineales bacterium]
AHITPQAYILDDGRLTSADGGQRSANAAQYSSVRGTEACGMEAAIWCPYGVDGEYPPDQRAEDGRSLCFISAPLTERMETLGFPEVTLIVASDQPNALLAVRLCDVSPDGSSLLVSRGLLNLTHRESHEFPTPLEPGWQYTVTVRLNAISHAIPVGHRWRVAISPTYWPHAWPSPTPVTLSVFSGTLSLPVRAPRSGDLPPFGPSEVSAPLEIERIRSRTRERTTRHDVARGLYEIVDPMDHGHLRLKASGVEHGRINQTTFRIVEGDPLSAEVTCEWTIHIGRKEWQTRVETKSVMTADASHFRVTNVLDAYEGNVRVFGKTWNFNVPRDLV